MGQIFYSCAYDIDTKTCCVYDADKFHANCYAQCGTVFSVHYLLRQKPYNVMWGGRYMLLQDYVQEFSRTQDLLGLSTYITYEDFKMTYKDLESKSYYEKVKFIGENNKLWKKIKVWDEAKKYFNWEKTHSVEYSGYLLNHTKKMAIDLADYREQSKTFNKRKQEIIIDAVPVLTETGGGTMMALFDGASIESTEKLIGTWCGDLLQIVDELPEKYEVINCCFAEIWDKARLYYYTFGTDKNGYILKNSTGEKYKCISYNINQTRGPVMYVKAEEDEEGIKYVTEFTSKQDVKAAETQNELLKEEIKSLGKFVRSLT